MIDSALSFFKRCTIFLLAPSKHHLDVINASLSLVFKSTALYLEVNGEKSLKDLHNVFVTIHVCLLNWIGDCNVIGGSMFGCAPSQHRGRNRDHPHLLKCDAEVMVCCIVQRYIHVITLASRFGGHY